MAHLAYIQVCRVCNQNCRFCSNPALEKSIAIKQAKSLIDQYHQSGYAGVIFSGGEPTMYSGLLELIEYAHFKSLPARIITNGQKTADKKYLRSLQKAGLKHVALSLYSHQSSVQGFLTENQDSFKNIRKTLENIGELGLIVVDVVTTINKYNAGHLSGVVEWLVKEYSFIKHFVWNNLDPLMNKACENPDTIPRLNDFELELYKAMWFLYQQGRSFRVERVPLCYMTDFAHCSTEARKIVKQEERTVFFLDQKGLKFQRGWSYGKASACEQCSLLEICPGLYAMDKCYSSKELYPVFVDKKNVVSKILSED